MKRVVCAYPGFNNLTEGKLYDVYNIDRVISGNLLRYQIKSNSGNKYWYTSSLFMELPEWRKLRIEEILK